MDNVFYKEQIERLKSQWPHAYSEERMVIFYNAFRNVSNYDFRDAITDCIANCKGAPLLKELTESINKIITIRKERERIQSFNPLRDLLNAENYVGDSVFMLKCNEARFKLDTKQITIKEFHKIMDALENEADEICKKKGSYRDPREINRTIQELKRIVDENQKPF